MEHSNKIIKFDTNTKEELLSGVTILSDAVKVTMGPRGRSVVIENPGCHPTLTKDGVTVARAVNLRDKFKNLGVQMVKEVASRTADVAGDGTTTATVLSQAIFNEGLKMLAAGYLPGDIKKGINIAVNEIIDNLKSLSIPVTKAEEVKQVATISANGESQVGDLIHAALEAVGTEGVVTVEEAKGFNSSLTIVEGMQIERGYLSPYFITDQDKMIAELDNPLILLYNKKIDSIKEIMNLLETVVSAKRSLLIVADDVTGDAMQGLVVNKTRGALKVCAIKAPGFGESRISMLHDLSLVLGCDVYSPTSGDTIESITIDMLGTCKSVVSGRSGTIFIDGRGEKSKIEDRISFLRDQLKDDSLEENEQLFLKARLAKLAGGVAILRVGGATEAELRERKDRVDDALNATKAAIDEGIVPGGGVALVRSSLVLLKDNNHKFDGIEAGINIVKKAACYPLKQIVENAGGTPEVVLEKVIDLHESHGYNALTGEFGDMLEMGIIDPVKVVRSALENAASAASMMLTVGCAMVEEEDARM